MGVLVFAAAGAVIWVLLAGLVGEMAEKRGRRRTRWYFVSLFCSPLIGFVVVSVLPSLAHLTPAAGKQCGHCSKMVKAEETVCPYCKADLREKAAAGKEAA